MTATTLYTRIFILSILSLLIVAVSLPRILGFAPIAIAVIAFLAYKPVFGTWPRPSKYVFGWAFAFSGLAMVSSLWAINADFAMERGIKLMTLLPLGALLISLALNFDETVKSYFQKMFPWAVILMGAFLAFELYTRGMVYNQFHEYTDTVGDIFYLSKLNRGIVIFVPSVLMAWPLVRKAACHASMRNGLSVALVGLSLAIFYRTESQSAQLCFIIGALFLGAFPYRIKAAWIALVSALIAGIIAAPWIAQMLFDVFPELVKSKGWFSESYAAPRMEIWDFVARRALESPYYGFGSEATKAITDFDTARIYHPTEKVLHPHNFVLQIWIEFGAIGVTMVCTFFTWLFMSISKLSVENAKQCLPTLIVCITLSSMTYGLWQGWWLGTFILLSVFAILSFDPKPSE